MTTDKRAIEKCDEIAKSHSDPGMRTSAIITGMLMTEYAKLDEAQEKGDDDTAISILDGILSAIAGCLVALWDTGDPQTDRSIQVLFGKILKEAELQRDASKLKGRH